MTRARPYLIVAMLLAGLTLCLWWPGIVPYDAVRQYEQALSGHYDDWHPPIMARLWSLFLVLDLKGSGTLLALQLLLYWGGLGLLAGALARQGARVAAIVSLCVGLSPLPFQWSVAVVKDMQLVAALVGANGICVWYRLSGRTLPVGARLAIAVLVIYAGLLRANAAFAVVPLILSWTGWLGLRYRATRAALLVAAILITLALSGPINHKLFGAEPSGVENTLPVFDLTGIAHFTPNALPPNVDRAEWAIAEQRHCVSPFYWDPFADHTRCGDIGDAIGDFDDVSSLYQAWVKAIVHHPVAYAEHRLAHLNATLRLYAPATEASSAAPRQSDPNRLGLGLANAPRLSAVALVAAESPLGVPGLWLLLAALSLWCFQGATNAPAREMGRAILVSVLCMTASFAVISIASDLRYHLWLMVGTAISIPLFLACKEVPPQRLKVSVAIMIVATVASVGLRAVAPAIPL